jgi:hypothetical protein
MQQENKASTSLFQRRLRIDYDTASRILDTLEQRGYVGPGEGAMPRKILSPNPQAQTQSNAAGNPQAASPQTSTTKPPGAAASQTAAANSTSASTQSSQLGFLKRQYTTAIYDTLRANPKVADPKFVDALKNFNDRPERNHAEQLLQMLNRPESSRGFDKKTIDAIKFLLKRALQLKEMR